MVCVLYAGFSHRHVFPDGLCFAGAGGEGEMHAAVFVWFDVFGSGMFFLLWEAGKRYNVCFYGICLLLMAVGICGLRQWMAGSVKKVMGCVCIRQKWVKGIIKASGFVAMICLLVISLVVGAGCHKSQGMQKDVYFCSKMGADAESINWKGILQADLLEQTIETGQMGWNGRWNRIKIFFANGKPSEREAEYLIELISLEDHQAIYREKIAPCNIKPDGGFVI